MERYVAVDNVCAWPNLTMLPDGAMAATIFNQPTHGGWEGDVECWASEDEGRLWTLRGIAALHEPETNRMNVAAGLARDGALIVIASGWSRRLPPGEYSSPHEGDVLAPWVCRSVDGGRTWTRSDATPSPPAETNREVIPFGDIVVLADGTLGVSFYGGGTPGGDSAYFYTSADDGRTWSLRSTICAGRANETTPVVLPGGRVLVAARTPGSACLNLFESDDHGNTWRDLGPVTLPRQHPGHLLLLADGRLLLTFGIRNPGYYGVGVRVSSDLGQTWGTPRFLVDFELATDGGYPATLQAGDGTLVTAYYCNGVPAHQRYHLGVVRWRLDE